MSNTSTTSWPAVSYETLPWERSEDGFALISKRARRKILPTYQAAIPASIATAPKPAISNDLLERTADLMAALARFDAAQETRGYNLPALLLRSESAASSQIERLTSSARNVALAELSDDAPGNATIIAGNVTAMQRALELSDRITVDALLDIHRSLLARSGASFAGELRSEPVWVGGSAYSPHGALFVPPQHSRIAAALDDLVSFAKRTDLNPFAKAALVHAQLETIHPFIDGNGRTGRTLIHKVLRREGVLTHATLPLSAGLLHNTETYMDAIRSYQEGDPTPIIAQVIEATELSLAIGGLVASAVDDVVATWRSAITERAGASIHRLPSILVEQPVVNSQFLADRLGITPRATTTLIERACAYGMIRPMGSRRRGEFYQSDDVLAVLEDASSMPSIRRMLARGSA